MIHVPVTDEQRLYAWKIANAFDVGRRGHDDGNRNEQYLGKLGEVVMADLFGFPRPGVVREFDSGVDFIICGKLVDLKTSSRMRTVSSWEWCGLMAEQYRNPKYLNELYCFASYNKTEKEMTFCGIIHKRSIRPEWFCGKGQPRYKKVDSILSKWDEYQVPIREMKQFQSVHEFFWAFDQI